MPAAGEHDGQLRVVGAGGRFKAGDGLAESVNGRIRLAGPPQERSHVGQ